LSGFLLWFIFWLAGTATILLVRPRTTRWVLLIAFFYLMAAWFLVGWMSIMGVWYSRILMRAIAWLTLPVCLHLSWVFPRPLGRIPVRLLWAAYLCSGILAGLEFFRVLPQQAYVIGLMLTLVAGITLLILHAIFQPDVRGIRMLQQSYWPFFPSSCSVLKPSLKWIYNFGLFGQRC
jgi:hypothetical protein